MHAVVEGQEARSGKYQVFFVTLSRRWWRGAVLFLVLVVGVALAWMDDERRTATIGGDALNTDTEVVVATTGPSASSAGEQLAWDDTDPAAVASGALGPSVSTTAVRVHPFDELRLERERQRSRQAELLQMTAQDSSVSEARRRDAHEQLLALWRLEGREAEIEHLLHAQGYTGVVVLSLGGAHVVVDGVLDATAAAVVGELVHRTADVPREAITIVDGIRSGR